MEVNLSFLRTADYSTPGRLHALVSAKGWIKHRAIGQPEILGQLKTPVTLSEIGPETFRLSMCLIQLHYEGALRVKEQF
jgi:hypothetical protein